jgi:proline dehydrogenase
VIEGLYRRGLLGIADTPAVADFVKSQGWKLGVGRFVAGETLDDVLKAMRTLQGEGLSTILDLLGEFVATEAGAEAMTSEILRTLDTLAHESAERYMSVKPTQLGLGVSFELALHNARRVALRAREVDARVCLDMENVPYVDGTLNLFRTLYEEGHHHLSTVLQSYLYRSMGDLEALLTLEPKPALRLVKGAYRESETVAFQDKRQVDGNYREMLYRGLEAGAHIGVATHDESIIRETEAFVRGAKAKHYEFQLLYGVKPALQRALVARGHKVRIYIPYGEDWYGYFSRRLAERPANLAFVLRGLLG